MEFARERAWEMEEAGMRMHIGAKSSSWAMRIKGVTSTRRVGEK